MVGFPSFHSGLRDQFVSGVWKPGMGFTNAVGIILRMSTTHINASGSDTGTGHQHIPLPAIPYRRSQLGAARTSLPCISIRIFFSSFEDPVEALSPFFFFCLYPHVLYCLNNATNYRKQKNSNNSKS